MYIFYLMYENFMYLLAFHKRQVIYLLNVRLSNTVAANKSLLKFHSATINSQSVSFKFFSVLFILVNCQKCSHLRPYTQTYKFILI